MDTPPPPPPQQVAEDTPPAAWVSLGAGIVSLLFLLGPQLFAVFGLAVAAVAVVAGWTARTHVPARLGITAGVVAGGLMLLVVLS